MHVGAHHIAASLGTDGMTSELRGLPTAAMTALGCVHNVWQRGGGGGGR